MNPAPRGIYDTAVAHAVAPWQLDFVWAAGWRHFGDYFFRYSESEHEGAPTHVIPLRVDVSRFQPSKSQRRILRRNADLALTVGPTRLDGRVRALFDAHKVRFRSNVPDGIETFLGPDPARTPCENVQVGLWSGDRLLAAAFLDLGRDAVSSVYAVFDPEASDRSLGICTILHEIEVARARGCRYYYIGYACWEPSAYDYKKGLPALEWYDWSEWRPGPPPCVPRGGS